MGYVRERKDNAKDNFKALRERLRFTQEKFAEELGVSPNTIGRIERGDTEISTDIVIKVAERFYVSADYLLGFASNEEGESPCTASCEDLINAQIQIDIKDRIIRELREKISKITDIVTEKEQAIKGGKPDCSI